jgi:mRNA-degrading endonuclease RelE of RelBE toxin-antitoxin system
MAKISRSHTTPFFAKKFKKLPAEIQEAAAKKILLFEDNPFHPGPRTHKLKGELSGYWSFYITREKYRVLFRFLPANEVIYYDIDTHDIYR